MSWKFVVRQRKAVKGPEFKIQMRTYRQDLIAEHRKNHPSHTSKTLERDLPREEWLRYGFRQDMTVEEAKNRRDELNAQARMEDEREARAARVARKREEKECIDAHLSSFMVNEFEAKLRRDFYGSDEEWEREKTNSHWRTVKKIILELGIDIADWEDEAGHSTRIL